LIPKMIGSDPKSTSQKVLIAHCWSIMWGLTLEGLFSEI